MNIVGYKTLPGKRERALVFLLEKALASGTRCVIWVNSSHHIEALSHALWTTVQGSFVPHGIPSDGNPHLHPVWVTDAHDNPNNSLCLVQWDEMALPTAQHFEKAIYIIDSSETWKSFINASLDWKQKGHTTALWAQDAQGAWQQAGI